MTFRTKPPIHYISPTPTEIRGAAEAVKLKKWSPDFVADLANVAAGGEVLPSHQWRHLVEPTAGKRDRDGDYFYRDETRDGHYTRDAEKALAMRQKYSNPKILNMAVQTHENVCRFLRTVDFTGVPGDSPLQKAVSLLKIMSERDGWRGGAEGDPLPIFAEGDAQDEAETLNDLLDAIESLDDLETQLLEEDDAEKGAGSGHGRMQKTVRLAQEMLSGKEIWLQVSRHLDKLARMRTAKRVKVFPDIEGEDVRHRPIESFSEMHRLPQTEWALPRSLRNYRIATRAAHVRERVKREEKQQLLYMMIDCSGSMDSGQRIYKAGGVLFNRLKAVVAGDAQIFVRFFDSRLFEEHHADTPAAAKGLMQRFQKQNFSGGGTNIAKCARETLARIDEIQKEGSLTRPELVIVTDGEDNVSSLKQEDFGQTRMHAFVVERSNAELVQLARSTGGVGIEKL